MYWGVLFRNDHGSCYTGHMLHTPQAQNPHEPLIGVSTGALRGLRERQREVLMAAGLFSTGAVEASVGPGERFVDLARVISLEPELITRFRYRSIHAPGNITQSEHRDKLQALFTLAPYIHTVVVHADDDHNTLELLTERFGPRLAIENLAPDGEDGRSLEEMNRVLAEYPQASLVVDIAHARRVDPSGALTAALASNFPGRVRHLHCSALQPSSEEHRRPDANDLDWIFQDIALFPHVPRIWEELPCFDEVGGDIL